tara:strand:+ start:661 stop:1128 length:468 start_codon:yes stop_codon:yes gene_type:complete
MFLRFKYHNKKIIPLLFIILIGCQLQEPYKNHGILFLKNRSEKLVLNKTNKNDVINIIGQPHSKSITDENQWMYIERILTKGKYHKLGKNILKTNNILVLDFDKYGILKNKKLFDKNDKEVVRFSKMETENDLVKRSFVQSFLESVRSKMYGNRK